MLYIKYMYVVMNRSSPLRTHPINGDVRMLTSIIHFPTIITAAPIPHPDHILPTTELAILALHPLITRHAHRQ